MATSAFKNFERDPKENMLGLMLDAVHTITQLKKSDDTITTSMQEQEKLAETLSKVRAFAEQRLLDVTNYYSIEHKNVVKGLCGVYAEILKASDDDVVGKLSEAVDSSVRSNFTRLKLEAGFDCGVLDDEVRQNIERLTRLSTRLDMEMEAGTWRRLVGSLKEPSNSFQDEVEVEVESGSGGGGEDDELMDDEMDMGWEEFEDPDIMMEKDPWQEVVPPGAGGVGGGGGGEHGADGLSDDSYDDDDDDGLNEGIAAPSSCWHSYIPHDQYDKWLLSGEFDVFQPYRDEWAQRYFILTTDELLIYADPEGDSLVMPARGVALLKTRRCTIKLEHVGTLQVEGTNATLEHTDGEQKYEIHLPRRGGLDRQWTLLVEDRLRKIHGGEDTTDSGGGEEGEGEGEGEDPDGDGAWSDPVAQGLRVLTKLVKDEAIAVLKNADVDSYMISCLKSLQQLDQQMVKCFTRSLTGKTEAERGKLPPETMLVLGELTEQVVVPWIAEKHNTFMEWKKTSLQRETWEPFAKLPDEDSAYACASVVDLFQILGGAVKVFEDSGMKECTSTTLQAQFISGISATIEDYVAHVGSSIGTVPVLPAPVAPPRGTKQLKSGLPPKQHRQPTRFTDDVENSLQFNTLPKLCTRLNTLVYAQDCIEEDFALIFTNQEDSEKGGAMLARVFASIDGSVRTVRAHIAAKIVHGLAGEGLHEDDHDFGTVDNEGRRGALLDGLYTRIAGATPGQHLRRLDGALHMEGEDCDGTALNLDAVFQKVVDEICEAQRRELLLDILRAFVKTIEFVLLNDDPYRIFTIADYKTFIDDMQELKDYFAYALDDEVVRHECQPVDRVLNWCDMSTEQLAGEQDSMWQLLIDGKTEDEIAKKNQIAMVVSHRRDAASAKFLKKYAAAGAPVEKGSLRQTMGTAQLMAAQSDALSMKKRSKYWPPAIKDLEKLQYSDQHDGWPGEGIIKREITAVGGGGGSAVSGPDGWPRKWFVLWPKPGVAEKDYPAKELKESGGRWLFQFAAPPAGPDGRAQPPPPSEKAEVPIPIAGAQVNMLPFGDDTFVIELTPQGQAAKIRLVTESMDDFAKWASAIGTLAA